MSFVLAIAPEHKRRLEMDDIWIACGTIVVTCLLVMILALEARVSSLAKKMDEKLDALMKR